MSREVFSGTSRFSGQFGLQHDQDKKNFSEGAHLNGQVRILSSSSMALGTWVGIRINVLRPDVAVQRLKKAVGLIPEAGLLLRYDLNDFYFSYLGAGTQYWFSDKVFGASGLIGVGQQVHWKMISELEIGYSPVLLPGKHLVHSVRFGMRFP